MRRSVLIGAVLALLAAGPARADAPEGWAGAVDARRDLASAQSALSLGELERSRALVARAAASLVPIVPALPAKARRDVAAGLAAAREPGVSGPRLAQARAALWTALLRAGLAGAVADAIGGDAGRRAHLAARPRVPRADQVHARRHRRDARGQVARRPPDHPGRGRTGCPGRPARHLRGEAQDRSRRRGLGGPPRLRRPARRAGRARARVCGDRLAELPLAAGCRRARPPERRPRGPRAGRRERERRGGGAGCEGGAGAARGLPSRTAPGRRASAPGGPARPLPPARADRVRPRRRGNPRHGSVRDPGGDHVPGRRRVLARGHRTHPARARRRRDTRADREPRVARPRPRGERVGPRRRSRGERLSESGALARADRRPLPAGVEGRGVRRRLRRDRGLAQPARERGSAWAAGAAPSRRAWRRTASSSSARSSGCAGSRPRCSSGSKVSSGTATATMPASSSS